MIRNYKMLFKDGKPKCMTLSYDDATTEDFDLCALMKEYGIAGTFNINTALSKGNYGKRVAFDKIMKEYMSSSLFEVATHGATHPFPDRIPTALFAEEILTDRKNIEEVTGNACRGHTYPYGKYNQAVIDTLKNCGIVYARTTKSTHGFEMPDNWLELHPTCHHNDPRLFELINNFLSSEAKYRPMMLYIWGHTFEFTNDNNWDVIKKAFDMVKGNPDIWFATNIEIYDYTKAFESLVYTVDGKTIYNPTAVDVWVEVQEFELDGSKNYHAELIPAGKTVRI